MAARSAEIFIRFFKKGNGIIKPFIKTSMKKNGRAQREIVHKPFYEGKGRHEDF